MGFEYINNTYGLNLKRGVRVVYSGVKPPKLGTVIKADGAHVLIRLDGERIARPYHPTWELLYLAEGAHQ